LFNFDIPNRTPAAYQVQRWIQAFHSGVDQYEIAREVFGRSGDLLIGPELPRLGSLTAEQRVQIFDVLAPRLVNRFGSDDQANSAFALALAAFICRPGLEQQSGLLAEHARSLPEAWLWLGALQAFAPSIDTLSLGFGGGWRVMRELVRGDTIWDMTSADLGLLELEVLARSRTFQRLAERPRLDVEIYPMIISAIRAAPVAPSKTGEAEDQREISTRQLGLVAARIEDALRLLRSLTSEDAGRPPKRRR
jgi:hypothetical protein